MANYKLGIWKILFVSLLIINIIFVLIIFYFINGSDMELPNYSSVSEGEVALDIATNKESINKLINNVIRNNETEDTLKYSLILTDVVEFYTIIPIFNQEIQLVMTFIPEALPNGDILLKQQSLQLGRMNLPVSYVLSFIQKQNMLPKWVLLNPEDKEVYLALSEIEIEQQLILKAKSIDLMEDELIFQLIMP